ncbi:MAG: sulfurtransferase TusA family protein [Porticoccaceae bacterium]
MNHTLDARNLNCPLPILRTRKALNELASGDRLTVLATDPATAKDIDSFCRQTGNTLVDSKQLGDHHSFVIRKG